MARSEGSAALKLDFGGVTTTTPAFTKGRGSLRLAVSGTSRGPEKYKELDRRRRHAQIKARHLLSLMEGD
jgi:hypothetical protein